MAAGAGIIAVAIFGFTFLGPQPGALQLDSQALTLLTQQGAFKTSKGVGERAIHVFVSADCKFCREIEPELAQLENVTVYRHLLPGHSEVGRNSAVAVWCSSDRVTAWKNVAGGMAIPSSTCNAAQLDTNLSLAQRLGLTTTPSIIYEDGTVSSGLLSAGEIVKRISKSTILEGISRDRAPDSFQQAGQRTSPEPSPHPVRVQKQTLPQTLHLRQLI